MKILLIHFKDHTQAYDIDEEPEKVEVIEFNDKEKVRNAVITKYFIVDNV